MPCFLRIMAFEDNAELQFKKPALCFWPLASPLTNQFTLVSHCYLETGLTMNVSPAIFPNLFTSHDCFLVWLFFWFFFFKQAFLSFVVLASVRSWIYLSECQMFCSENLIEWRSYIRGEIFIHLVTSLITDVVSAFSS